MHGIINVLKPAGMTSQKVVTIVKHKLNVNKVGHLGTLDPSGTGVLPVCVNKATKLFDYFLNKDKVYRAVIVFGKTTTTLDSDGEITKIDNKVVNKEQFINALSAFIGPIDQIPPNYSRKCVNGVRAYDLARKNQEFTLKPKRVEIYNLSFIEEIEKNKFLFEVHCSSGTYIRSLIRDIATKLSTVAYMGAIIRLKSGCFTIEDAVNLEEVSKNHLLGYNKVLADLDIVDVDEKFYNQLCNGVKIQLENSITNVNVRIFCKKEFFGIADIENGVIKIKTNLREI